MKYVLITPARNEEINIERTIRCVIAQTWRPVRWIIVDDGSTDRTADVVQQYARVHSWIVLFRRTPRPDRTFAGKAAAVNEALERLQGISFDVIGNLDADVSFPPDYMEFVIRNFDIDPKLGVAGTPFTEEGYDSSRDSFEGENYVAGPCQLFRNECFRDIGGYVAHRAGGVDWIAVMTARMKGWKVQAFQQKRFHHHRTMGTAERSPLAALYSYGEKDYYLGGSPIWQLFRVAYRMGKRPVICGGLALLAGYTSAAIRRIERPVSPELMQFHRRDQMRKLGAIFSSLLRFQRFDPFSQKARGDSSFT